MSHGHSHGGCADEHDHDHDDDNSENASKYSLYLKIDTERLHCLNEELVDSGKTIFKPWDQRLDTDKFVQSDCDEELLFNIPLTVAIININSHKFTGDIRLKGIIVIGGEERHHPSEMKLFKNRPNMSFDDVGVAVDQEFELHPDTNGTLEYSTKIAKFSQVSHLSIYFPKNFGAETTKIYYIGLKGDFTQVNRSQIAITNYEMTANPADHKTKNSKSAGHQIF